MPPFLILLEGVMSMSELEKLTTELAAVREEILANSIVMEQLSSDLSNLTAEVRDLVSVTEEASITS
tara:strand:+ start:58 stop:258 length:201 start_codon:yes stop_codon:yes gene_type:complete